MDFPEPLVQAWPFSFDFMYHNLMKMNIVISDMIMNVRLDFMRLQSNISQSKL